MEEILIEFVKGVKTDFNRRCDEFLEKIVKLINTTQNVDASTTPEPPRHESAILPNITDESNETMQRSAVEAVKEAAIESTANRQALKRNLRSTRKTDEQPTIKKEKSKELCVCLRVSLCFIICLLFYFYS